LEGTVEQLELAAVLHFADRAWRGLNPDSVTSTDPGVFAKNSEYINGLPCTMEFVEAGAVSSLEPLGFCTLRREGAASFVDLRSTRFLYVTFCFCL
jgi:hypothetical protein